MLTEYELYTLKCCKLAGVLDADATLYGALMFVGKMLHDPIICTRLRLGTQAAQDKTKAEGDPEWFNWNEYLDEVLEAMTEGERAELRARIA
jgi:hypothetical protein